MGDKVQYQHGGGVADGKTFKATAPISSPPFGDLSTHECQGTVPGSAPWPVLNPDPELPN
jgi:hypothetical protein